MPFVRNQPYAEDVGDTYGEYESTFFSDKGEVRAELFRRADSLVAYVSFTGGKRIEDVREDYVAALRKHAVEAGYEGKLKIIYSVN